MGKYMRRAKTTGDFAVMEVSSKSSFGVRTRAKTLALQRLQNSSPSPDDSFCFLQLRSRRLEKFLPSVIKPKDACKETVRSSAKPSPKLTLMADSGSVRRSRALELTPCSGGINFGSATSQSPLVNGAEVEVEVEVSCGENMLEVEEMNRYNFDPVNDCPLPGRYEWVKLV
ncbi:cyclin-dependent kinase inhibitor 4-like isoform X2 [Dendrobium catenatum]|uniref:cyclin-dependent kinase inhibitor 4-like isoform X2 n=1 Tax=Dendrobium catenatum TaxID=906689 RepID=UPI00109F8971|nr:cyclin-dependent kinase inhibitor 4-like isoform X2 [Dendrobium catenatum]